MSDILVGLGEFIITPYIRWITLLLTTILTLLLYLNQPQRYSYTVAFTGFTYKWHLYGLSVFGAITSLLTFLGLWIQIPFTDKLPNYWYVYIFILFLAIITQITIDSPQIADDGTFNPPPTYMLSQQNRVILSYVTTILDALILLQVYIYFGIADTTKKTLISQYFLERFGGWYSGNKLDFIFDWSGIIDTIIKIYILMLQTGFHACEYNLPSSWNA
jgi:hypothetical protein